MSEEIRTRIFGRIRQLHAIHKQADVAKIADLAWEEMMVSFLEYIYKFEGLELMFEMANQEKDEKLKLSLAVLLLAFDETRAKQLIQSLLQAEDMATRESANDIMQERHQTISELAASNRAVLEKIKKKRKISSKSF